MLWDPARRGSSRNTTSGSSAIALAIATRLRIPPDISDGILSAASSSSTSRRSDLARSNRSCFLSPENSSSGSMTFSRHVIDPKSAPDWYITPILRKSPSRVLRFHSSPATVNFPASTGFSPIMCFMMVDFPHPDPPRRMNTSPFSTSNVTSRSITAPGYPASTCSSLMTGVCPASCIGAYYTKFHRVRRASCRTGGSGEKRRLRAYASCGGAGQQKKRCIVLPSTMRSSWAIFSSHGLVMSGSNTTSQPSSTPKWSM